MLTQSLQNAKCSRTPQRELALIAGFGSHRPTPPPHLQHIQNQSAAVRLRIQNAVKRTYNVDVSIFTITSLILFQKVVMVYGDSQWRSMTEGYVSMADDRFNIGVNCTPGAKVADVRLVIFSSHFNTNRHRRTYQTVSCYFWLTIPANNQVAAAWRLFDHCYDMFEQNTCHLRILNVRPQGCQKQSH